ncbi:AAA family ATPase [uncultured Jatrophihabitans sp.]|uniref:AAA family ATPase n=1 Tax=uncultured Jatrophihabitans sp. TaxID=1610747 RepID=UPI0035CC51EB
MRGTLVGRDAVLELAVSTLGTAGRVLIEGPAGIGKTALLTALVGQAQERGTVVLRCAPTETEAALPLAALGDLLQPLVGDLDSLPAPQLRAACSALLLQHDSAPVDERALAAAVRSLLDTVADRSSTGLLVAIDDAPWLDPPTERALQFALRRVSPRVRVAVARRTGDRLDPRVPLELDARYPVERLRLTPLGVGPLHRLLAQRFGVSLSRPIVARLARESGGNPLLAIELTRAALRLPRMPGPGGDFPVPASMYELVDASLGTLRPDSVRAARLAALLSAPHVSELAAAGIAADALDAVEEVGLVTVDDADYVRFVHPVYASAVRASIPPGVRRRFHEVLARSSTDRDERARHLAQCATEANDEVALELAEAAERARARGAPDLAADFYERAGALTVDGSGAVALRLRALYCLFDCGNYRLAAEQVDAVAGDLDGDLLAEALLLRAAIAFATDDLPLAASTAQRALASATPSSRLAGRIHAHLAVFVDLAAPAREHAEAALALLENEPVAGERDLRGAGVLGRTDRALLASVLMLVFLNEVRTGLPPRVDLLDRALAMEDGNPSWLAGTIPAIWWKGTDQHERARERLHWMLEVAIGAGDEPLQHELMEHLAEAETLAGNYEGAATWIASARELAAQLGAGVAAERWLGGTLDALRGRPDEARAAGEAGLAEAAVSRDPWLHRISLQLTAFVALADGRAGDAAAAYAELNAAMNATGLAEPLASRFEPDWLEACVGIGDLVTAEVALDRLARRHDRLPRPWTTLALARSRVLIASAAGQDTTPLVDALLAARDATPADVVPFDRARCLLVVGLAHRRARRKRAARDALLAAATEFDALGAPAFAARARADADRTGGRIGTPDELSSSELRVAELAATGATNREIADALFISPKTVEANLARTYRKLAIGRRVELAAALRARAHAQT